MKAKSNMIVFDGLKGLMLLATIGLFWNKGQSLNGMVASFSLVALAGFTGAYYWEHRGSGVAFRSRQVMWQTWLNLLWLTCVTAIAFLILDYSHLVAINWQLASGVLLIGNFHQATLHPDSLLVNAGLNGVAHLWYFAVFAQVAAVLSVVAWSFDKLRLSNLNKSIAWLASMVVLSLIAGGLAASGIGLHLVEWFCYAISAMSGIVLVYLLPYALNALYATVHKQYWYLLIGSVSIVVLGVVLTSVTIQGPQDLFLYGGLINLATAGAIFTVVAGLPLARKILEFPLLVAMGRRLGSLYMSYIFTAIWLGHLDVTLQWVIGIVMAELWYWFFVKGLPPVLFINSPSWGEAYDVLWQDLQTKQLNTLHIASSLVALLLVLLGAATLAVSFIVM